MMFLSLTLLSVIALFSSAVAAVTHEIIVGNGLKFDPPYIVRPQISHSIECRADCLSDRRGGGHCFVYLQFQQFHCNSIHL